MTIDFSKRLDIFKTWCPFPHLTKSISYYFQDSYLEIVMSSPDSNKMSFISFIRAKKKTYKNPQNSFSTRDLLVEHIVPLFSENNHLGKCVLKNEDDEYMVFAPGDYDFDILRNVEQLDVNTTIASVNGTISNNLTETDENNVPCICTLYIKD